VRDDLVNAGATWLNGDVVRDGHVLSGRGMQDLPAFVQALIPLCAGEPAAAGATQAHSDPPQDHPVEQPNQSLRWLAAPSFGTMLSLALLGVGVVAAQRVRHRHLAGNGHDEAELPADPPAGDASARARD
jgi:protease I